MILAGDSATFKELQEKHGYPELTPAIKARIFALKAARVDGVDVDEVRRAQRWDPIARARQAYRNRPLAVVWELRPRTCREHLGLVRAERGSF